MPLIFIRETDCDCIAAVWRISETEEQLTQMFPFTEAITLQLQAYRNAERRLQWLASRALIFELTKQIPHVTYNPFGQPIIAGFNKSISISHTKGFAAVAISKNTTAGIDIEIPHPRILRVADRFLHPKEKHFIPVAKELRYCTIIWCAKEVLFKITTSRPLTFNSDLRIISFSAQKNGFFNAKVLGESAARYKLHYICRTAYTLVWNA